MQRNEIKGKGHIFSHKKVLLNKKANQALESLREKEIETYQKLLQHSGNEELDPIKKKKITEDILIPGKQVQSEWWYFTGHVNHGEKEYGFEWCIFKFHPQALRFGFIPLSLIKHKPFLVLHTAITDKTHNTFYFEQDSGTIHKDHIHYDSLDLNLNGATLTHTNAFSLKSKQMELKITPTKKLVKHFEDGYHLMSTHPDNPTYYVTYPRSKVKGHLLIDGKPIPVDGQAWFDHQKCVIPQKSHMVGWDWLSIMLDDNTELMLITLRDKRGQEVHHRMGTYIETDETTVNLESEDIDITETKTWTSQKTGITYPARWHVLLPHLDIDINVTPDVNEQEVSSRLTTPISYWEGACSVEGTKDKKSIKGKAYAELVGYDKRFTSQIMRSTAA